MNTTTSLSTHQPATEAGLAIASSTAVQEVQASLIIAKNFPRDEIRAMEAIQRACERPGLAANSQYAFSRGGTSISGPNIRLTEVMARCWGNMDFGFRELSRGTRNGKTHSTVEAFAWDKETNTRVPKTFEVIHWRDRKNGEGYPITDERDIYELIANQAMRRVRACVLSLIPADIQEDAIETCNKTMQANCDTSPEAIKKLVDSFSGIGVEKSQLEKFIQRKIDSIQPANIIRLRTIFGSIRDGMSVPSDWFEGSAVPRAELSDESNPFKRPAITEPPKPPTLEYLMKRDGIDAGDLLAILSDGGVCKPETKGIADLDQDQVNHAVENWGVLTGKGAL